MSKRKPLEIPDFKSDVPDYLLQNATPIERYVAEQMNINHQQNKWLLGNAVTTHDRLNEAEDYIDTDKKTKLGLGVFIFGTAIMLGKKFGENIEYLWNYIRSK